MNIVIFGTGRNAKRTYQIIREISGVNVVAFTETNHEKIWTEFCCLLVLPLKEVAKDPTKAVVFSAKAELAESIANHYGIKNYYLSVWDYLKTQKLHGKESKKSDSSIINGCQSISNAVYSFNAQYMMYYANRIFIYESHEKNMDFLKNYLRLKTIGIADCDKVSDDSVVIIHIQDVVDGDITVYFKDKCKIAVYVDDQDASVSGLISDFLITDKNDVYDKLKNQRDDIVFLHSIINLEEYNPISVNKDEDKIKILNVRRLTSPYDDSDFIENCIFGVLESNEYVPITPVLLDREYTHNQLIWDRDLSDYISSTNFDPDEDLKSAGWRICYIPNQLNNYHVPEELKKMLLCGNIVFCNYDRIVNEELPCVFILNNEKDIRNILLHSCSRLIEEVRASGIRQCVSAYSIYAVLERLCVNGQNKPLVTIVLDDDDNEQAEHQTYSNCYSIARRDLTNEVVEKTDYITFFNSDYEYGEFYIEDLVNGFKFSDAEYVTYIDHDSESIGYQYVDRCNQAYSTLFTKDFYINKACSNIQAGKGLGIHTSEFNTQRTVVTKNYAECKASVIIPIFNNGKLLVNKAFNSLLRCSMFDQLQIILVDDGSTDKYTQKMIRRLDRTCSNVSIHLFEQGGSGSASRPRNKGIEMAQCRYLFFLDPDDEVTYDGYKRLYEEIERSKSDVVIGNAYWVDSNNKLERHRYYSSFLHRNKGVSFSVKPREFIISSKFEWLGFCNLVFDKNAIIRNHISQKEGIISEDLLFVNEMLLNSSKVKAIDEYIYYYYASISNSQMNSLKASYFEKKKKYVVELYKVLKNNSVDIRSDLCDKFQNWFIDQFITQYEKVSDNDEKYNSRKIIVETYDFFCSQYGFEFSDKRVLDVVS